MRALFATAIVCRSIAFASAQAPLPSPWEAPLLPSAEPAGEPVATKLQLGKGVTFEKGEASKLTIRARIQLRASQFSEDDGDPPDVTEFVARRIRLLVQGHVRGGEVTYYLQLGFSNQDTESDLRLPLRDAYLTWTKLRDANIRFGQMKVPFGKQRVVSSSALEMVDRSIVTNELSLDRDVGLQVLSEDVAGLSGHLAYNVGLFSGDGRNRLASAPGVLVVARGVVRPFGKFEDNVEADHERVPSPKLAIGLGAAYNDNTNRSRSTFQTPYEIARFDYRHLGADVLFKFRGLAVQSELMYRKSGTTSVTGMNDDGDSIREYARNAWGYYVQAGYLATTHAEITARIGELFPRGATDPVLADTAHETGGGVNWYFQKHDLKIQSDYFYLWNTAPGKHQIRVQAQLYF
jgi:phosphate-selective porin OprO and OprP